MVRLVIRRESSCRNGRIKPPVMRASDARMVLVTRAYFETSETSRTLLHIADIKPLLYVPAIQVCKRHMKQSIIYRNAGNSRKLLWYLMEQWRYQEFRLGASRLPDAYISGGMTETPKTGWAWEGLLPLTCHSHCGAFSITPTQPTHKSVKHNSRRVDFQKRALDNSGE